jgi:DNA-directed RNA polymerase sigma subunit (sigma70/sigma32)
MKSDGWRDAIRHVLADHHPLDSLLMRLWTMLHVQPGPVSLRKPASANRGRWWDASADEALFWREEEHLAQQQRMDRLRQGLNSLRPKARRGFPR